MHAQLPPGFENIIPYLSDKLNLDTQNIQFDQFKGGFSNITYSLTSGNRDLVLRRPPLGLKINKAHDMVREFRILIALQKAGYAKIPKPIICCEDESVIGAPFFIMEKVDGLILRNKIPVGVELKPEFFLSLAKNTIDGLLELHQLNLDHSGLSTLGKPEGYVGRQVSGWSERYFKSKTDELPEMVEVSTWLQHNLPEQQSSSFIHNDYKYDNLVLFGSENPEIKGVLDWEMATVGDPLMDLGTTLAYWCEQSDPEILKMFNLTYPKGNFTRNQVIGYYAEKSNLNLNNILFYYVFGLFKVAVIAQQIYKRYVMGYASDPRFAALIKAVSACGKLAVKSIHTQKI